MNYAETLGTRAKAVESAIATAAPQVKNQALAAIADALLARQDEILEANAKDLAAAQANNMTASLQDRLRLTPARISGMADAARQLIAAEDPIGSVDSGSVRPNGLQILKTRVPLGVIGIIFESRPNVTVDALIARLLVENPDEAAARLSAERLYDVVRTYLLSHPAQKKRVLMLRVDEAPVRRIRGQYRCHVLLKAFDHPEVSPLLRLLSELAGVEDGASKIYCEVNPATMM